MTLIFLVDNICWSSNYPTIRIVFLFLKPWCFNTSLLCSHIPDTFHWLYFFVWQYINTLRCSSSHPTVPVRKTKGIQSSRILVFWISKVFINPSYICITPIFFIYKISPVSISIQLTTQGTQGTDHHYPEYIKTEPNYKRHMHLHYARNLVASFFMPIRLSG